MSNTKLVFGDVPNSESNFKPGFEPGIFENVMIIGADYVDNMEEGSNPRVDIKFSDKEGTIESIVRQYTNETVGGGKKTSSMQVSLKNAKHICNAVLTEAEKGSIVGEDQLALLLSMLNTCMGKPYRMKFIGKEYINKDGNVGIRVAIGFPNFAEPMSVPKDKSLLRFNINNAYDYNRVSLPTNHFDSSGTKDTDIKL